MKIVILDAYTANPGDLSWDAFAALGELTTYDRSSQDDVVARASDADAIFSNKVAIDALIIAALPRLRFIGVLATGHNVFDGKAARARGIPICNVPEYGTPNVAQAVFALLLELTNRTGHHADTVRAGRWSSSIDWCYWDYPLTELGGRTLGILGYGRIGAAVAQIARAFGMRVIVHRRSPLPPGDAVSAVDLDTLFRESDVLSLHCPLTEETREVINAQRLAQMRSGAFLINTARGPLVDERALADALNAGRLAGAALDVLSQEPPAAGNPLLTARNCIITPHIAWATREARARLIAVAAENLRAWQAGTPQNVVN